MPPTFITIITLSIILTIATFALDWIRRGWAEIVDEAFGDIIELPDAAKIAGGKAQRSAGHVHTCRTHVGTGK